MRFTAIGVGGTLVLWPLVLRPTPFGRRHLVVDAERGGVGMCTASQAVRSSVSLSTSSASAGAQQLNVESGSRGAGLLVTHCRPYPRLSSRDLVPAHSPAESPVRPDPNLLAATVSVCVHHRDHPRGQTLPGSQQGLP